MLRHRDLVIKFKSKEIRDTFYKNRKLTAPCKNPEENIYINDRITDYRKSLFYEARKLYKTKRVIAAWTQFGNILIRETADDKPKQISSYADLEEFYINTKENNEDEKYVTEPGNAISDTESLKSHLSNYQIYVEPDDDF